MQLHRGPPTPLGSSPNNTCPFNHNILLLLPLLLPTCQTKIVISGQREHHFHLHHTEAWLGRSAWWRRRVCACLSLIGWGLGREDKTDLFTRTAEGQIKSIYVEEIQYVFSRPCKTADRSSFFSIVNVEELRLSSSALNPHPALTFSIMSSLSSAINIDIFHQHPFSYSTSIWKPAG